METDPLELSVLMSLTLCIVSGCESVLVLIGQKFYDIIEQGMIYQHSRMSLEVIFLINFFSISIKFGFP